MRLAPLSALITLAAVTIACGGQQPAATPDEPVAPPAMTDVRGTLDLGGAVLDAPEAWEFSTPSSSMRLAEATIPGPGGPALLTVFFFGEGGGGGVDANLARWVGQVQSEEEPVRDRFTVGDFTISTIEVDGTLLPSTMGTGPSEPIADAALVGAVIEGPGGPWFLKVTGPEATVSAAREAFDGMLRSVQVDA
jgi:hypothetical protein